MSLIRSSLLVGAGAFASRILGFVRDVLFAQVLGAGPVADAFLAAFRLPNVVRRTLSEGGLNPALVPALARLRATEAPRFAGEALSTIGLALLGLVAAVELAAGLVVLALAPGLSGDAETLALATLYTRLAFPLVAGVTLASVIAAALNQRRRFLAATLAPLATNAALVVAIPALGATSLPRDVQAAWLAGAASVAGLAQLAALAVAFRGPDAPIRLAPPRWSPALRRLLSTASVTLLAGSAAQLVVLVGMQAASFLPSGVSWLYYADRLVQLPVGAIGAVTGMVLLPELAARHAAGERGELEAAEERALALGLLVALPAAVALAMLAEPIARVLFERGAFEAADTQGTAAAIAGMSAGLPFAVAGKVLAQSLFAQGAVRPTLIALLGSLAATALAGALIGPALGMLGYGLAVAAGFAAHAAILATGCRKAGHRLLGPALIGRLARTALATAVLAGGLAAALPVVGDRTGALGLAVLCVGGLVLYAAAALVTGALTRADLALLTKKA